MSESALETPVAETATDAPVTTGTTILTEPTSATAPTSEATDATQETPAAETKDEAPVAYDFTLPEGVQVDQALVDAALPVFTEHKVPPAAAQALVQAYAQHVAAQTEALTLAHQQQVAAWRQAVEADPELGGAHFAATRSHAERALQAFGTPDLRQVLEESGLGNHPAVVRFVAEAGKRLAEDTLETGAKGGAPAELSVAERMYANSMTKR